MELPKSYNFSEIEPKIYPLWEKNKLFSPNSDIKKKPYTIIMPPPNANANLHIGHGLYVIQDILIRFERMRGKAALYLPGADHAGFETQVVFEKHLEKEGKSRFDFERETFYSAVFEFVQGNRKNMENQLRRLGMSCDWNRMKFTLDSDVVDVVYNTFFKLYNDGLVYRGERIVNYCTKHGTGLSDLEVNHQEQETNLWHISYTVDGMKEKIIVATTRPETMLGDTAVAVNPKDTRYKKFIGKHVILPIISRKIPIIADSLVDPKFGTGAVKVTPAHDSTDFEIGLKHKLPKVQIIGFNGRMTKEAGMFEGMKVSEAREAVAGKLLELGALNKVVPYKNTVGICYKCSRVLEPLILPQWFIKIKPLAEKAVKAVKSGKIKILPKKFEKNFFIWMEGIKDWNISRQIWWGIPIPVWFCDEDGEVIVQKEKPKKCSNGHDKFKQDPDTFDTWFSSGQWPFAALGGPDGDDARRFYPTDVMETGWDIIFFWVARMIMLGIYETKQIPFKTVYLHGLLRDKHGHKISKSRGNVIDPMEMIDKYGSDALRLGLIMGSAPGNDTSISEDKIRGYRNFANKIWNASRYVLSEKPVSAEKSLKTIYQDDKEFLDKLDELTKQTTKHLEKLRISDAASGIYQFFWHYYADIYIEKTKNRREEAQPFLVSGLITQLKLLHPFLPFLTESIWQEMKENGYLKGEEPFLVSASWPTKNTL